MISALLSFFTTASPWWGRIILGLGIAAFGAYEMHKLDTLKYDALKAEFSAYKDQSAANGKMAELKAKNQEGRQEDVTNAIRENLALANSNYDSIVKRLRLQPPVRPDSSQVPLSSCVPSGPPQPSTGEWVPLADYRTLEGRAAYDAQTIVLYQDWIRRMQQIGAISVQ